MSKTSSVKEMNRHKLKSHNSSKRLEKRNSRTPLFLKTVPALVVLVKPNGKLYPLTRITGFSIDEILSNCTQIMKLTSAARKLYSNHGELIESLDELKPNDEIYVSLGEPFIDPLKLIKESILIREGSFWGLNGLYIPKSKRKAASASVTHAGTRGTWRILTFSNGDFFINNAVEVISNLKDIEEVKSICGKKLNLNGQYRKLYNSDGVEITDLKLLHDENSYVWNPNSNAKILGPIWASKKEDLNQSGVYYYFQKTIKEIKNLIKSSKSTLNEIEAIENSEFDKYPASKMKSFSKPELKVTKEEIKKTLKKYEKTFEKFNEKFKQLPEPSNQQVTESEISTEKGLYQCAQGLRLKVYQNGQDLNKKFTVFFNVSQAKRGINDSTILFNRFLDCLSESVHLSKVNDFSKGLLARRVFTEDGVEIKNVSDLSYDQVICVSYGENWIDPSHSCVCAKFYFVDNNLEGSMVDLEFSNTNLRNFKIVKKFDDKNIIYSLPVLEYQKRSNVYMFSSLHVMEKENNMTNNIIKSWSYTITGRLILKSLPSLCLTLITSSKDYLKVHKHSLKPLDTDNEDIIEIPYYAVQLNSIQAHDSTQMWKFQTSGQLYNQAFPEYFLTYLENRSSVDQDDFVSAVRNSNILAIEQLPEDLQKYQRWAFKQESFVNLSQWKLCDLPNPEWHKSALTWPLKSNGDLNDDLKWPIEGLLIPCAPPLNRKTCESESRFPIKLRVLRNNDHNMKQSILVNGPDLTKLIRKWKQPPYETHCTHETLLKLEFQLFLDSCTSILRLPSAARRLFTENGNEIYDLEGLQNYDVVFVSVGEIWCSPSKVLTQIKQRSYANKLTVDIERLKYFNTLHRPNEESDSSTLSFREREENTSFTDISKDTLPFREGGNLTIMIVLIVPFCSDFVIGARYDESGLLEIQIINEQSKLEIQKIFDLDNGNAIPETPKESVVEDLGENKSCHERCCNAANLKFKNKTFCDNSEVKIIEESPKRVVLSVFRTNSQQFLFKSSRILMKNDPNMAIFADEIGKPVIIRKLEVNSDNEKFKWIIHDSGIIESMHFRGFVINIYCPKMLPFQEKFSNNWSNCLLVLEKPINTKYGRAHQRFKLDSRTGLFYPFSTNDLDKDITAAVLSGFCTKYVCSKPLSQQGSYLEINQQQEASCNSCVRIMNGRYLITPLERDNQTFSCNLLGGFKVMNIKPNSLQSRSEEIYQDFVHKLEIVRKKLTIKICKSRITESVSPNLQVLLHLNNNKTNIQSQKVTAKSISQLMAIATGVFNLQKPIRILYTVKGEPIVDDLSFRNIMSKVTNNGIPAPCEDLMKTNYKPALTNEIIEDDNNSNFNVSLSEDQCFFIIEFANKEPTHFYCLQINISGVNGINLFSKTHSRHDSAFLFNYEIFNNQINTELFVCDSDFEGEQTELSIKSSPKALNHLFTNVMNTLRLQLISARVNANNDGDNDGYQVDIESIDAIADFSFEKLSEKLKNNDFERFSTTSIIPLVSTDNFEETPATVSLEILLNRVSGNISNPNEEVPLSDIGSVINEPVYKQFEIVELWASSGEPFCFPKSNTIKSKGKDKSMETISQLKLEIDKKKFLLRTMKGERFTKLNAGTLEPTPSEKNPIIIKGNWQFPTSEEIKLEKEIESLQTKLNDTKPHVETDSSRQKMLSRDLYKQKHLRNCFVHINGKNEKTSVSVWGESVWEILENSAQMLGLKKSPKFLFKKDGMKVTSIDQISTGDILAVSPHSVFISPKASELQCEIKANWGRARCQYGEDSTDIKIQYRPNTLIDVDPFEPPEIMRNVNDIPSTEAKTIKVFENGQKISEAKEIFGYSLGELLKIAATVLNLNLPVKCLYTLDGRRITSFKEILIDDVLAASVSGSGLLIIDD